MAGATFVKNSGLDFNVQTKKTKKQKMRYSRAELLHFKKIINEKIAHSQEQKVAFESRYKNNSGNGTEDTSPQFKPLESGTDFSSKEKNMGLAMRQERFIRDLKNALVRIENKTYGVCRVTGKLINKKRLELVPHATLSMEAKRKQDGDF